MTICMFTAFPAAAAGNASAPPASQTGNSASGAQEQQIDPSLTNKKAPYPAASEVLPPRPVKPENPNDAQAVVKYAQAVSAYTKAAQVYIDGATNDVNDIVAKRNEAVNDANAVVDEYNQFADSYGKKGE